MCSSFGCYSHACFATYAGGRYCIRTVEYGLQYKHCILLHCALYSVYCRGVQFINNTCEGAGLFLQINGGCPAMGSKNATAGTKFCGPIAVVGNTVRAMHGQGSGCMLGNDTSCPHNASGGGGSSGSCAETCTNWCNKQPPPWAGVFPPPITLGGQCGHNETLLPPSCDDSDTFAACRAMPGVAGACYNRNIIIASPGSSGAGNTSVRAAMVKCLTATQLAEGATTIHGITGSTEGRDEGDSEGEGGLCVGYSATCTFFG